MYCRVVVAALLLMVSAVASAAASEIVEGQRGRSQGFVGDYSNTALTKRVVPRASESLAENEVVLQSYFVRKDDSDDKYEFIGTLLNNSIAGVYDVEVTLYFPLSGGSQKVEEVYSVYGTPAHILTDSYRLSYQSPVTGDYIPPKKNGYFEENYITLPDKYDFSKVRYEVEWTWTLQATIDTKVRVLPESMRIEPHEYAIRYESYKNQKRISGTLINGLAVPIERLGVTIIVLDKTNKQALYISGSYGLSDTFLTLNGTANFVSRVYFSSGYFNTNDHEFLFVPYYRVPEAFVYPASYSDKAYISGSSTTIRDTVFVAGVDSIRINALKMGDLNEDGVIDIADFLIFTDNFGKTIGTD